MRVSVDKDLCTGCGLCVDACPAVFVLEGDVAEVKTNEVPKEQVDSVREQAENCPSEAIIVDED